MRNFVSTAVLLTAIATPLVFVDPALAHSNGNGKTYLNTQDLWRQSMNNNDTVERWNGRQGSSPIYYRNYNNNECRDWRDNPIFVNRTPQHIIVAPRNNQYTLPPYDSYSYDNYYNYYRDNYFPNISMPNLDDGGYYMLDVAPDEDSSFKGLFLDDSRYSSYPELVAVFKTGSDQHGNTYIAYNERQTIDRLNVENFRKNNPEAFKDTIDAVDTFRIARDIASKLDDSYLCVPYLRDNFHRDNDHDVYRLNSNAPDVNRKSSSYVVNTPSGTSVYVLPTLTP